MRTYSSIESKERLILITGATGGLGKAFAVECAGRGWNLVLTDRFADSLQTLATGLHNEFGVETEIFPNDLTREESRTTLFRWLQQKGLILNGLINVAGIDHEGAFLDQTPQQLQNIIRLNIEGTVDVTRRALPLRDPDTRFMLINVCSLAAFYPMPVKATYAASKRFLLDLSIALHEELRSQNVSVTALCPAGMPTNQECIRSIQAQGWMGQITTLDVGRVAFQTVNAALRNQRVVIPGAINQVLQVLGGLVPTSFVARLVGNRWHSVQSKRSLPKSKKSLEPGHQPV